MKSGDSQMSGRFVFGVVLLITALGWSGIKITNAATVPPGFTDSQVTAG